MGIILDNISQGLITRGLFHEAALNIFSVLILYWKKFCTARFASSNRKHSAMSAVSYGLPHELHDMSEEHREGREWHGFFGGETASLFLRTHTKVHTYSHTHTHTHTLKHRRWTHTLIFSLLWSTLVLLPWTPSSSPPSCLSIWS